MPRRSREAELLQLLSSRREGFTWRELLGQHHFSGTQTSDGLTVGDLSWSTAEKRRRDGDLETPMRKAQVRRWTTCFPRKTLARHLKALAEQGSVEKIPEPRKDGERGQQCTRYRIPPKFWESWGCLAERWPCRWIGHRFFLGVERRKTTSSKVMQTPKGPCYVKTGEKYVRLFPGEVQEYREYMKNIRRVQKRA